MFVGGISWNTNEESMKEYFERFGAVRECVIKRDESGTPRGFGFVEFVDVSSVDNCLSQPEHYLDKKKIDPKRAVPRDSGGGGGAGGPGSQMGMMRGQQGSMNPMMMGMMGMMSPNSGAGHQQSQQAATPQGEKNPDRVFVGGLPASVTAEDLSREFMKFGTVLDTKLMMDKDTGRSKGYAFIQFENDEVAQNVVQQCNAGDGFFIHDKRVDVKSAVRRSRQQQQQAQQQQQQGSGYPGMAGMFGGANMDPQQMAMMSQYMMMQNPQFMAMAAAAAASMQQGTGGTSTGYQMPGMVDPTTGYPMDPNAYGMAAGASGYGGGYDQSQQQQQQQQYDPYGTPLPQQPQGGDDGSGNQYDNSGVDSNANDYYSGSRTDGGDDTNSNNNGGGGYYNDSDRSGGGGYSGGSRQGGGRSYGGGGGGSRYSHRGGNGSSRDYGSTGGRYDRQRDGGDSRRRHGGGGGSGHGQGRPSGGRRPRGGNHGGAYEGRNGGGGSGGGGNGGSGYHPYSR
ncbi:hypothetical protein H4219_004246 [Mycoemilia scoparia]|uniref:RRM domain-containing protein n=1 Tax=Mycoemilia scoparia TaxID=417184 RepID=A0A9W8DRP5_9FUNG|nr:hypothetical protein H4219_004246 [Mycoemilia scoparia]